MSILDRFKIVERDKNGKVIQIYEVYRLHVGRDLMTHIDGNPDHTFTVTKLGA